MTRTPYLLVIPKASLPRKAYLLQLFTTLA
nr:MAG TPA: hypothetical protein [Caudoviricetes sp.]